MRHVLSISFSLLVLLVTSCSAIDSEYAREASDKELCQKFLEWREYGWVHAGRVLPFPVAEFDELMRRHPDWTATRREKRKLAFYGPVVPMPGAPANEVECLVGIPKKKEKMAEHEVWIYDQLLPHSFDPVYFYFVSGILRPRDETPDELKPDI